MKITSFKIRPDRSFCKDTGLFILSYIRRIGFYITLFVLLLVGGVYIFSEFNKQNVYINSFEVSASLANQGITGIRLADQLLDNVAVIRETTLDRYQKEYLNLLIINTNSKMDEATVPGVNYKVLKIANEKTTKFPDIGTLIGKINRWLRKFLRLSDIDISGAIILTQGVDKILQLTISSTGQRPQIFFGKVEEIDKVLFEGAQYVCKYSDPYSLALYQYISQPNTSSARYLDTIQFILANSEVKDQVIAYNFWAWILKDQRKYDEAALILRKGAKLTPNNIEILNNLANLLVQSEKFTDAEEIYKKIISLGKDESMIWNNWGWLYNSWDRYSEAIPKLKKALELDDENAGAYVNLGISLKNTGKVKEAKEAHFKAIKVDEKNWLAYYNLGLCYMFEDAYAKATENFEIAIMYFPNFAQAYHELGKIFFYQANLVDALKMFNKAIEIDDTKFEMYLNRCRCLLDLKEFSEAIYDKDKILYGKRHANRLDDVLRALDPFKDNLQGVVVESTFNWYWLVDGLQEQGYSVHLANPSVIQQYEGLKHIDDQWDSFWLAHMQRLGILPEGYIYPKENRAVRDLLRRRLLFVRHSTSHILSLQSSISRNLGFKMSNNEIKKMKPENIEDLFACPNLVFMANNSLSAIKFLKKIILDIEKKVKSQVKMRKEFEMLRTIPGIGNILGLTIMLEVGDIARFPKVGDYSSYCRCVESKRLSNGKKKGENNKKNGNKYLAWAYVEADQFCRRYCVKAQSFYQSKEAKTKPVVAIKALSNKLSKASYYIMRDQVCFDEDKLFR